VQVDGSALDSLEMTTVQVRELGQPRLRQTLTLA
jgi:hypothetical protein